MATILILRHERDDSADLVIRHLSKKGVPFLRFNTEEFQTKVRFSVNLTPTGEFRGRYIFPTAILDFQEIGVVWNRRVHRPLGSADLDYNPEIKEWMRDESEWGLNNSFTLIEAPFVNPWEVNERLKFNKWVQMKRATELGLEIPFSCLTNVEEDIQQFWEETSHEMIFKKIRRGFFRMSDGKQLIVHTNRIPPEKMTPEAIHRMRFAPIFLQRHIPKKYDIRAIVVGAQVFAVAIHSQNIEEGVVDWRTAAIKGKIAQMRHERIDLGSEVNRKLIEFTKSFGAYFGAIDLILTPDDRLIFLEDNPSGQWGWLEEIANAPISLAIAELLISFNGVKEEQPAEQGE